MQLGLVTVAVLLSSSTVQADEVPAPHWLIHSLAAPTSFSSNDNQVSCVNAEGISTCDRYLVSVRNNGGEATDGSSVTLTDLLPAGLTVANISFHWSGYRRVFGNVPEPKFAEDCEVSAARCTLPFSLEPDDRLLMIVYVEVEPGVSGSVENTATVTGGGVREASTTARTLVDGDLPSFGESLSSYITGPDGKPYTQAGGHPYEFTAHIDLPTVLRKAPDEPGTAATAVQDVKDTVFDLPLGFLGSAVAAPKCTFAQLSSGAEAGKSGCPTDTVVGHIASGPPTGVTLDGPIYNLTPERGVAAEFGYIDSIAGAHVLYATIVPSTKGYVLQTTAPDVPQVTLAEIEVTLYGNPAARDGAGNTPIALFTNPASCTAAPLVSEMFIDSWQAPGRRSPDGTPDLSDPNWAVSTSDTPPVTGCNQLRFNPALSVQPETDGADAATGLQVDLKVPQSEEPGTLATPPLRDASVTLPRGLTINPSSANGLGSCTEAQIALSSAAPPSCPDSSKIGTVEVTTPLLGSNLVGAIYLATANENMFHTLLAAYIVIDDPTTGVVVKIPGKVTTSPGDGEITGVFEENPQFPFSDLKLRFFGGSSRGELATPASCGTATTTSDLMPWSAQDSGPDATPTDSFPIDTGCVSGFAPQFAAGAVVPRAGAFSPLSVSFSRSDAEQGLAGLAVSLPPGLVAKLSGVPLCSDAEIVAAAAATGSSEQTSPSCPSGSQVGTVKAGAGVGEPFFLPGRIYLTGPYKGAPYGLAVIVPALAGPFDLGTVVIRDALYVDSSDAHVTAVSDPFPTIIDAQGADGQTDGFPIRLRRVDVTINRPTFALNPTNCSALAVNGTFTSTTGQTAPASSRFEVGGCRELPFKPTLAVSTQARTSRVNGASLRVEVASGPGQANIGKVHVALPKQLPSRLTTLHKACSDGVFNANPAACPTGSLVGTATAVTPLLEKPFIGPAYLVSHGGAAFPDLVIVLQGNGITLDLDSKTDIKKGITTSTFNSVPDAPVTSFVLTLPEGPHSILGAFLPDKAKGSMCAEKLTMPTLFTGQNGATVSRPAKIGVTGCPHHPAKKPSKEAKKSRRPRRG